MQTPSQIFTPLSQSAGSRCQIDAVRSRQHEPHRSLYFPELRRWAELAANIAALLTVARFLCNFALHFNSNNISDVHI
jgi:hypothetical protein